MKKLLSFFVCLGMLLSVHSFVRAEEAPYFGQAPVVDTAPKLSKGQAKQLIEDSFWLNNCGIEITESALRKDKEKALVAAIFIAFTDDKGVARKSDKPELFKGIQDANEGSRDVFISHDAMDRGAFRFIGKKIDHVPFNWCGSLLTKKGYYIMDSDPALPFENVKIKKITPKGQGYTIMASGSDCGESFLLTLQVEPGDIPGSWKRISLESKEVK